MNYTELRDIDKGKNTQVFTKTAPQQIFSASHMGFTQNNSPGNLGLPRSCMQS